MSSILQTINITLRFWISDLPCWGFVWWWATGNLFTTVVLFVLLKGIGSLVTMCTIATEKHTDNPIDPHTWHLWDKKCQVSFFLIYFATYQTLLRPYLKHVTQLVEQLFSCCAAIIILILCFFYNGRGNEWMFEIRSQAKSYMGIAVSQTLLACFLYLATGHRHDTTHALLSYIYYILALSSYLLLCRACCEESVYMSV